ncbi:MAG: MerR family DNA-binding protein [Candidatus Aminicenantales bacterium]
MRYLTIGQLAKSAKVNIQTIRYYERRGLIPEPLRRDSGYRQYPLEMTMRIQFIKRAKELGFSLKEIGELLSLRLDPKTPCSEVKRKAEAKLSDIKEKIRSLQHMKKALIKLTEACKGRGPVSECPILEELEK